jgi:hypothetical protein
VNQVCHSILNKVIPRWKRAAAIGIKVGIHDPEVGTGIVDGSHIVCSCVDVNCSLSTGTTQLICCNAALNRITSPTERICYVLEMSTGERWAPIISSLDMICYRKRNKGEDSQSLYGNRTMKYAWVSHDRQLHRCTMELISLLVKSTKAGKGLTLTS